MQHAWFYPLEHFAIENVISLSLDDTSLYGFAKGESMLAIRATEEIEKKNS